MEKHDEHIMAFTCHMMNKMLGGKTLYEHKRDHIERQHKLELEWANTYPQKGERVVFRSINASGDIFDGCGYVEHVHVHEFRTGFALYTVKLEDCTDDEKDTYQLYSNHPNSEKQGEWIKRV